MRSTRPIGPDPARRRPRGERSRDSIQTSADFDWTLPARDYRDPALLRARAAGDLRAQLDAFLLVRADARTPATMCRNARGLSRLRHPRRRRAACAPSTMSAATAARSCWRRGRAIAASSSSAPITAGAIRATGGSTRRPISARDTSFDARGLEPPRPRRRGMARPRLPAPQARRAEPDRLARPDP